MTFNTRLNTATGAMEMAPQALENNDSGDGNGAVECRRRRMKGLRGRSDEATGFGA
jgi:hypothetical protein